MTVYPKLTAEEVRSKLEQGEQINLLDVREHDEWQDGHIPQARHIPMSQIVGRLQELDVEEPIVVVCRSGSRSTRVCDYLHDLGYSVVNMTGGMLAWTGDVAAGNE